MSASIHCTIWCWPMGTPKLFALLRVARPRPRRPPRRCRPPARRCRCDRPSSADMAILNPCPSAPSRWAAGTRQCSNRSSAVSDARMPSLSSVFTTVKPGRALLDEERRDPVVSLGPIRLGEHEGGARLAPVGDEDLAAVEHVAVAVAHGQRVLVAGVRARPPARSARSSRSSGRTHTGRGTAASAPRSRTAATGSQ